MRPCRYGLSHGRLGLDRLLFGEHGSDVGRLVQWVPHPERTYQFDEGALEACPDGLVDEDPLHRDAHLTGVAEGP